MAGPLTISQMTAFPGLPVGVELVPIVATSALGQITNYKITINALSSAILSSFPAASANTFFGGPVSGPSVLPAFRVLTTADIPWTLLTADVSVAANAAVKVVAIQNNSVASTTPTNFNILQFNTSWFPTSSPSINNLIINTTATTKTLNVVQAATIGSSLIVNTNALAVATGAAVGTTTDPGAGVLFAANYLNSGGFTRVAANFGVVSSTTMVNISGLSTQLQAGSSYIFRANLYLTSGSTGGAQFAVAAAGGATNIIHFAEAYATTVLATTARYTALATALSLNGATTPTFSVQGLITAQNAGIFSLQIAQVAATTTTTFVLAGSWMTVFNVS